ncbi:PREDICTED: zinc finger CCHC domain-containing protein 4 isoform X2 [Gavialis gangeticus]|uniref:zinc finger CCHC domain-containing protein 4 isoform X2 n=1 Tax=Gavialis gangeticus TaxID=94835 RepID=UPI00092E3C06|nr:PREDICTED: zinc finger CCHC domain-containing protein 4 isoform X2 [Gavialis gangeticus]
MAAWGMEASVDSGEAVALSAEPGFPAPCCPHGPALLFVKISQGKEEGRRFYACSACRDRKDCNFFQWENEKVSDARLAAREEFNRSSQPSLSHRQNVERLHELIRINGFEEQQFHVKSLLLDIDFRYSQFYTEEDFCHYNMFNHYFFGGEVAQEVCRKFLHEEKGEGVIMVTDPPFGGLVEALAFSFKKLIAMWREAQEEAHSSKEMPIFWIFPYFFESRILEFFPSFTMMDYQVDYDNHMLYKHGKTGRKQSPVRIFTNLSPSTIVLPIEEGYRFCSLCQRYVSSENQHCKMCNSCTSKDGRQWRHCVLCQKCVKPSWVHCNTCNHCALQDHACENVQIGCFICGGADHKRSTCPHFSVTRRAYQADGKQRQMKNKKLKMDTIKKPSVKQRKMRVLKGKIKNKKE